MKILFSLQKKHLNLQRFFLFSFFIFYIIALAFLPFVNANAAINKQINYQGKLTTAAGVAVANGTYNMEFILYTVPSAGTGIWTETRTTTNKVQVTNGLFSVLLGEVNALTGVDFNQTLYLGVNIGGTGTPGWDGEMTPRKKLGVVPTAVVSENAINIIGGVAGALPYQSAASTTLFSAAGTTGQALVSGGTGAPTWFAPTLGSVVFAGASGILAQDNTNFFWDNTNKRLGVGIAAPTAGLHIDTSAGTTTGLKIKVALNQDYYNYLKPDGTSLYRGTWDTSNFHQYLNGGNMYVNLNGNTWTFDGNSTGAPSVTITGGAQLYMNAANASTGLLRVGTGSYATVGNQLTAIAPIGVNTWAWNGTDGYSISSTSRLIQTQLSTTAGDARLGFLNTAGTEVFSIKTLSGNVGIGTTTPGAQLSLGSSSGGSGVMPTNTKLWIGSGSGTSATVPQVRLSLGINGNPDYGSYFGAINPDNGTSPMLGVLGTRDSVNDYPAIYLKQGNVGIGTTAPGELLSLGLAGTTKGVLSFSGDTSGKIIIQPATAAGTYTLTLPVDDGTSGQFLQTDGSGVLTWAAGGSGSQTPWTSDINAAGFTLYGNSTASGNLTLNSTSNATKGYVLLNSAGGDVGIGTPSPRGAFDVDAGGASMYFDTFDAGKIYLGDLAGNGYNTKLTIDDGNRNFTFENGNVGIRTTTPTANFQVDQEAAGPGTVSNSASGTTVTGVGTHFLNTFRATDSFTIGADTVYISAIASDTSMTTNPITNAHSGVAYTLTGGTRFVVLGNGNVGINTSTPGADLEIVGHDNNNQSILRLNTGSADGYAVTQFYDDGLEKGNVGYNGSEPFMQLWAKSAGLIFGSSDIERMRIDNYGNLGVGTTTPSGIFQATQSTMGTGTVSVTGTAVTGSETQFTSTFKVGDTITATTSSGSETKAITTITSDTVLVTAAFAGTATNVSYTLVGGNRFSVLGNGRVGVGTTTPSAPLEVKGTGTGATIAKFTDVNTTGCTIATGGTIACSSDVNLKKNIEDINYGLDTLMQLRPVLYNWKYENDGSVKSLGFIAQEVEAIIPKLVSTDENGIKSLNTTGIVPVLAKAVQEMNLNIEGIAGTVTPIVGSASETFVTAFFNNVYTKVGTWMADATNGIGNVFANVFNAKEKICVDGECLNKDDIHALLLLAHPAGTSTPTPDPVPTPTPTPEPTPVATCTDGILNQDETSIDAGGICTPPALDPIPTAGEILPTTDPAPTPAPELTPSPVAASESTPAL